MSFFICFCGLFFFGSFVVRGDYFIVFFFYRVVFSLVCVWVFIGYCFWGGDWRYIRFVVDRWFR